MNPSPNTSMHARAKQPKTWSSGRLPQGWAIRCIAHLLLGRSSIMVLQDDLKHRVEFLFKRTLLRVLPGMFSLNIHQVDLWTQGERGHMPGAEIDVDPTTPIIDEGFHLCEVFRAIEIDRG